MITTVQTSRRNPHATAATPNGRNGNGNDKTWRRAKMCSNTVTLFCGQTGDTYQQ